MKLLKKIKKVNSKYINKVKYYSYYKKMKIDPEIIYLESQQGRTLNGNMFYILKEMLTNKEYKNYKKYISIQKNSYDNAVLLLEKNNINGVNLVITGTREYYKILAKAKYLITDTSFLPFFIKKEGQEILNTWHGTPLKCLGKKAKNGYHAIGNVQKNFNISDYLLYPNEFTRDHMIEDYMLENICNAKVMLAGYPRNEAFFDDKRKEEIRKELELEDKQIIAYMPTWREAKNFAERVKNTNYLLYYLFQIDQKLNDNQILYVNLHPLARKDINFSLFENIKPFPQEYETYEFLNISDCLITDYSSVFFDYAITGRKIIIFDYDKKEYLEGRGLYFNIDDLPFPQVQTVTDLMHEINTDKKYDDTQFIKYFCKYDEPHISKKICEKFILKKNNNIAIEEIKNNKKENIIIYVGNLSRNGITSSIRNLLGNIDLDEKNYYLTFSANKIKNNAEQLLTFPEKVKYISTVGRTDMTIFQKIISILFRKEICPIFIYKKVMKSVYKDEIKRLYGNAKIDTVIQFSGYEHKKIIVYSCFDCKKVIYVHSDMLNEIKTRHNQNYKSLKIAYRDYDKVAIVNEDLRESTVKISGRKDNIYEAKNLIMYKEVLEKSKLPIEYDECTEANVTQEELLQILDSNSKKIISIGRFSPEKGHMRLINAFRENWKKDNSIYLIIIGGVGKDYIKTIEYVEKLDCKDNIILIRSISNPYPILNKCDYFVLSSFYEGFGIVIAEADILGKPVISTDIIGPRKFMKTNGGYLVENSEKGLTFGIEKLLKDEIKAMNADYEEYNQEALNEFYDLINN